MHIIGYIVDKLHYFAVLAVLNFGVFLFFVLKWLHFVGPAERPLKSSAEFEPCVASCDAVCAMFNE